MSDTPEETPPAAPTDSLLVFNSEVEAGALMVKGVGDIPVLSFHLPAVRSGSPNNGEIEVVSFSVPVEVIAGLLVYPITEALGAISHTALNSAAESYRQQTTLTADDLGKLTALANGAPPEEAADPVPSDDQPNSNDESEPK